MTELLSTLRSRRTPHTGLALLAMALLALLAGCGLPTSPSGEAATATATAAAAPTGHYECTATEYGLLVGTGLFIIHPDGTISDEVNFTAGTWTYDETRAEFTFGGDLDIDRAVYQPGTGEMTFYLKPGASRQHAPSGELDCERRGE